MDQQNNKTNEDMMTETTSNFINSDGTVEFSPSENMDTEIVINKDGSFDIITSDVETTEETTEVPEESEGIKLFFKPGEFVRNLDIMGKGMLGIFIVIGIIIASVYALGMIGKKKNNKQQ